MYPLIVVGVVWRRLRMATKGHTKADGCARLDVVDDELMCWLMCDIISGRVKGWRILQMTGTETMLGW